LLLVLVQCTYAGTDVSVGDRIRFFDREGTTGGGEFGVAKHPNFGDELFRTFCVQTSEFMDFNADGFIVTGVSDHSVLGGVSLSSGAAYLYWKFRQGNLPDYVYTPGTSAHITEANKLQKAIWYFQGQSGGANNSYVTLATDAMNAGGTTDEWVGKGIGNVRIMNLTWATTRSGFNAGDDAQDQLVLVPTPTGITAGAGLLAAIGVYSKRRRRFRDD
jgi:hypothetical protein